MKQWWKASGCRLFVAVVAVVTASMGLTGPVEADSPVALLFPFITTEAGKFTFITIENNGFFGSPGGTFSYHFTYATKAVPVENRAGCDHFDSEAETTPSDMMIFEVSGKVKTDPPSNVLFEGAGPDTSTAVVYPLQNRIGFLIVDQSTSPDGPAGLIYGTAVIVDSASGLTWSYSTNYLNSDIFPDPDFSGIDGHTFIVAGDDFSPTGAKVATWYPASLVTTGWYVLPLSSGSVMASAGGGGIRLGLQAFDPVTGSEGAFDLDEQLFSGGRRTPVRCLGIVTRADLLQPGVLATTDGGGWSLIAGVLGPSPLILSPTDPVDPGGVYGPEPFTMFKIQSATALGALKTTVHQEPDLFPCFDPTEFNPIVCPATSPEASPATPAGSAQRGALSPVRTR